MYDFFLYIIKVSAIQTVFFLFYLVFFKKKTSEIHQRIFLIASLVFSFIIPFIKAIYMKDSVIIPSELLKFNETINEYFIQRVSIAYHHNSDNISWLKILYLIYFAGMSVCIYRFVVSIFSLSQIIRKGTACRHNHFTLVFSNKVVSPFSFFHFIIVNRNLYSVPDLENIIAHENVHIKQLHSFDIILIETIQIIAWFNPLLNCLKRSVIAIHEYIADRHVIESGADPLEYQMLLIKQNVNYKTQNLTSHLNASLIKKRIMMLTNSQNTLKKNHRYFLVIPLLVFVLMAFSYQNRITDKIITGTTGQVQSENRPSMFPVKGDEVKITSAYGMRMHPFYKKKMMHSGIDIAAAEATPVVATANGIVTEIADKVYDSKGYGKYIVIVHDKTYTTMYAQLHEILVKEKQAVRKGEIIGKVGKSGLSSGPHLHYEVWKNNEKVDPADFLQ